MHSNMQDKWRCSQHVGMFCYIEPGKSTHIQLSSGDLGVWSMAIINEAATMSCPPRTVEFEKVLHPRKRNKTETPPPQIVELYEDPVQANKPIIHYHMNAPTISAQPDTPKKKRRRSTIITINSSPIPGFEVPEYNSEGLCAFLRWCTEKYKDCEFIDAYESLAREKMGIDIMLSVAAIDLHKVCNIPFGTAVRIIGCYPKWLLELKSVVIYLYMTVSELIPSDLWCYNRPSDFKDFFS